MTKIGTEIERWFLPKRELLPWDKLRRGTKIIQGYLAEKLTVRVRIEGPFGENRQGNLTIKGPRTGLARTEITLPITLEAAAKLMALCISSTIAKTRYFLPLPGATHPWEIDIFFGNNQGLIKVEIELSSEKEEIVLPPWIDREVTGDDRYSSKSLAKNPFNQWPEEFRRLGH